MRLVWLIALSVVLTLAALGVAFAVRAPAPAIIIAADGCRPARHVIAADQAPHLRLFNQAAEPMVVTIPDLNNAITVAPGQHATLEIQPYAWGTFTFFCLTDRDHAALEGVDGEMFTCGLDSYLIRPYALSSGALVIDPHDRLQRLDRAAPKP